MQLSVERGMNFQGGKRALGFVAVCRSVVLVPSLKYFMRRSQLLHPMAAANIFIYVSFLALLYSESTTLLMF